MAGEVEKHAIVFADGAYGNVLRMQRELHDNRVIASQFTNPDFVMLGKSFGCHAERVEKTADFADAFARAMDSATGAVLELMIDPEAISPKRTLSQIRDG